MIELPGVDPESVKLVVGERALAITGDRPRPRAEGRVYQQMEIEYGPFRRVVRLPEDVDPELAKARVRARDPDGHAAGDRERGRTRPAGASRSRSTALMSDVTFELPEDTETDEVEFPVVLPVLPLKETVVFPQSMAPLAIGQERSVRLIDDVVAGDRLLALVTSKDSSIEAPGWDDIYEIGTVAVVHKMIKVPDGTQRILVGGLHRVRLVEAHLRRPVPRRRVRGCPGRARATSPRWRR